MPFEGKEEPGDHFGLSLHRGRTHEEGGHLGASTEPDPLGTLVSDSQPASVWRHMRAHSGPAPGPLHTEQGKERGGAMTTGSRNHRRPLSSHPRSR